MDKVRLGIIGVGNIGTGHVENILAGQCPEVVVTAAADRRESRREWTREHLPDTVIFNEGEELIESGLCDAVMICVPHYQHPPLAISALKHGLHTLVEKPAGVYTLQVREMNEEADRHPELAFALMYNQRTNCVYRKLKEMIDSGEIGTLKRVSWLITDWYRTQNYYDSGAWRATWAGEGGGVLLNQCPHQLDLLIWLCGLPKAVTARCWEGKWHRIEVEDDVSALLEFENGATGVFVASTGDLPGTNRLEIDCEKGKLVCEDGRVRVWRLAENEREICFTSDDPWYRGQPEVYDLETDGENPQHYGVINAFAAHLLRGGKLIAEKEDGLRALQLSNAIHLSGWTGRRVEIPADPGAFNRELAKRTANSVIRKTQDRTYETNQGRSNS